MEKQNSPAKPNDDELKKYVITSLLELSGIDTKTSDNNIDVKTAAKTLDVTSTDSLINSAQRISDRFRDRSYTPTSSLLTVRPVKNVSLFDIVNNMNSSLVPKNIPFIDDIQHQTTMAIVETYATYMFVKDKFSEIISDTNKFAEIKSCKFLARRGRACLWITCGLKFT